MMFPTFKGDALPKKKATKKDSKQPFTLMSKSDFEQWCSTNQVEEGSTEWLKLFNQWRKAVTSQNQP